MEKKCINLLSELKYTPFLHLCKLSLYFTNQNLKGLGSVSWPGHNSLYN